MSPRRAGSRHTWHRCRVPFFKTFFRERFQLKIHREIKQGDIYAITVAKSRAQIKTHAGRQWHAQDLDYWAAKRPRDRRRPPRPGWTKNRILRRVQKPTSTPGMTKFEADQDVGIIARNFGASDL